jgi:hypothetical protein
MGGPGSGANNEIGCFYVRKTNDHQVPDQAVAALPDALDYTKGVNFAASHRS